MTLAQRFGRVALAAALVAVPALWLCSPAPAASPQPDRDALARRWAAVNHTSPRVLDSKAPVTMPPPRLTATLKAELAQPGRYQLVPSAAPAPPPKSWLERLLDFIGDRWNQLMSIAFGRAKVGREGAQTFVAVVALAVIGLAVIVAFRMLRDFRFDRASRVRSVEMLGAGGDAKALFDAACERAARGDYALAARLLFAASVGALALQRVLDDDRSATVGEFRRILRGRDAALVPAFDAISTAFVTSAYAERPIDAAQWQRARDAYLQIEERQNAP